MNDVAAIRRRMFNGTPEEGDVSWCRQRIKALENWPESLSEEQEMELNTLREWVKEHG